ncbi:sigma factor regulator N-terminal domain-containing protein [Clostridia bacterium]|nr:sigma factor regulator N-terminal domain-containing protein [Clostridia bacterium]
MENHTKKEYKLMDDMYEVDDLEQEEKWKKILKKAKTKSIFRNLGISLLVFLLLFLVGNHVNNWLIDEMRQEQELATEAFNMISAPNKYLGSSSRFEEFFRGYTEVSTYKIIGGKVVPTELLKYSYGLTQDYRGDWTGSFSPAILSRSYTEDDAENVHYNELGQREMLFYYPFIKYDSYRNDLELLKDMDQDMLIEVALSLDGDYSIADIQEMFPTQLIAWYWVLDLDEAEEEQARAHLYIQETEEGNIEHQIPNRVRSEETAYGVKAYSENGEPYEEPLNSFRRNLEMGMKQDTRFTSEFKRVYQNTGLGQASSDDYECFGGLVVSGSVDELLPLLDHPHVVASTLGVTTRKY